MAAEEHVMPGGCERLFVLWNDPVEGARYVVGELWRDFGLFFFAYSDDVSLGRARRAGFHLLPEFPEQQRTKARPYSSPYLFSTFAQRIPSPKRPDRNEMMASWGVEHPDDQLEVLARSGGVQMTDNVELAEYRSSDDDLQRPLYFRVAGEKYYEGGKLLRENAKVELRREPKNEHDSSATLLLLLDATTPIGYVPRQYSAMIARLLDAGEKLEARAVRRLVLPEDRGRWIIRLQRVQ
jgi:hypothetical protein